MQLTSFLILSSFPLEDEILSIFPFHPRAFPRGSCTVICGKASIRSVLSPILCLFLDPIHAPGGQWLLPGTSQVPVQLFLLLKEKVPAQPPAQRYYPNLANLVTAQRPVLFTDIMLNPLATVVILHFPGTTKGYSLSSSLFPGGRSSGVRAPSSPAEQSSLPLPVSWALARHFLQR